MTTFPPPPPPGRSGGIWGTTTYVGPLTWALAIASIPSIFGWMIILLFCPLDSTDVYKVNGDRGGHLYTADGKFYKSATRHNFQVLKSEHALSGVPFDRSPDGIWGTTQHVGALTWAVAIAAIPTILGPFIILLFMPLDNHDIYKDDGNLYLADGLWFKTASEKNFDIRRSAHTINGAPKGLSGGVWGTTTYVGPLTICLAIAAIPTILGFIIILMFCPLDRTEVYNTDKRLYLPDGTVYKRVTANNFHIRKSEHTNGAPAGISGGVWGTTTYIGPMTWSVALIGVLSGVGWFFVLMFLPLDSEEVYNVDGVLHSADGTKYKSQSGLNFYMKNSKHVLRIANDGEETDVVSC